VDFRASGYRLSWLVETSKKNVKMILDIP
jgi:hypothetical protein